MDEINNIEDKKTWMDFGRQGYFIIKGAMEEGATLSEAMKVATAFYAGMFKGAKDDQSDES